MFKTTPTVLKKVFRNPDSILDNRLEVLKNHRHNDITISSNITLTKVETRSAVWAAASLLFLCGILLGLLLYTRMWSREPHNYRYDRVSEDFEYAPGHSQFSLLKSSQKFMSIFRMDKQQRKLDSLSRVKLMVPINEEEEEEEDDVLFQR